MSFTGFHVCSTCKPVVVRKLEAGLPVGAIWRKKKTLIMTHGARLPDRCVKCNTDAGHDRMKRKLTWHAQAIYLFLLFSPLVYALVAVMARKRAEIEFAVCEKHRRRRTMAIAGGWICSLVGIGCFFMAGAINSGWPAFVGIPLLLGGIIWGAAGSRLVTPAKIDATHVHLTGIHRDLLAELPEWAEEYSR